MIAFITVGLVYAFSHYGDTNSSRLQRMEHRDSLNVCASIYRNTATASSSLLQLPAHRECGGVPAGQPASIAMNYDNAGNLSNDTYTGAGNRTYDAENKITSAWGGNNQAQLYGYDATGQRIKRSVDGVTTWQVYGFGGELVAEYPANGPAASPQKEYGYRNGQLLVTAEPGAATTENGVWTRIRGVSASGNALTKTGAAGWNAGGGSTRTINSGDGYVEFTASETNL